MLAPPEFSPSLAGMGTVARLRAFKSPTAGNGVVLPWFPNTDDPRILKIQSQALLAGGSRCQD
jgi:hypothetical protein